MRRFSLAALLVPFLAGCGEEIPEPASETTVSSLSDSGESLAGLATYALREALRSGGELELQVLFEPNVDSTRALSLLRAAGLTSTEQTLRYGGVISATGELRAIERLAKQPGVMVIDLAPPPEVGLRTEYVPSNADSRDSSNADDIASGGELGLELSGAGVVLGVVDEGPIRETHVDFQGRVVYIDSPGELSSHATHVTGTMAGAGVARSDAAGFAPEARVFGWTFNRDTVDLMSNVNFRFSASNHSYGFDLGWDRNGRWVGDEGFGKYGVDSRRMDAAIHEFDIAWVKAAGNDRGQGSGEATEARPADCSTGFDCLATGSVGKNVIVVAAAADLTRDPAGPGSASATGFSSRGPTDDGRIKPDIAANGDSLLSTTHTADDGYHRSSGTSMAAPSVTGGIGLVVEHYRDLFERDPTAAEVRGLLIHTALRNDDEGRPNASLGWGMMDLRAAVEFLDASASERHIAYGVYAGSPQAFTVEAAAGEEVALTLVWTDPAGLVNLGGEDDTTPALVNNLDLRGQSGGSDFYPFRLSLDSPGGPALNDGPNDVDNVERIVISGGDVGGDVTFTLNHRGTIQGGTQQFVLLSSNPVRSAADQALFGSQRVIRIRAQNDEDPIERAVPLRITSGASVGFEVSRRDTPFWLDLTDTTGSLPADSPTMTIDARGLAPTLHYGTIVARNTTTVGSRDQYITVVLDVRGLEFPEVNAGDDLVVPSGAFVILQGSGRDPTGEPVTFEWEQVAGTAVEVVGADTARATFIAPTVASETTVRFTLVASNGSLDSAPDAVNVQVIPTTGGSEPADNRCETALEVSLPFNGAGLLEPRHDVDFFRVTLESGETIIAQTFRRGTAFDSTVGVVNDDGIVLGSDDDGGADLYSLIEYSAETDGAVCVAVSSYSDFAFDGSGAITGGEYGLTIEVDRPNLPPTAVAGDDLSSVAGELVTLDGSDSSDADGFTLGYEWTQTSGIAVTLVDDNGPAPRFFAPAEVVAEEVLQFELRVFDADAAEDTDSVQVTIAAGSAVGPLADAGGDRIVPSGALVHLSGRGEAVAGGTLSLSWEQSDGGSVTLDVDGADATFFAPIVESSTALTFSLTVDEDGTDSVDSLVVLVIATEGLDEPANNHCSTAPLVGTSPLLVVNESIAGTLSPTHDVDFYRVEVVEGSVVEFEVAPNGPRIDTTMGLYRLTDGEWDLRSTDDDGGSGTFSRIDATSEAAGELCVAVSHFRDFTFDGADADAGGPYLLTIDVIPPEGANNPPVPEAGDDVDAAPGELIFLDASASTDPEGQPLTFVWSLEPGPTTVDIFDSVSALAQVIVPNDLESESTLVFRVDVNDGRFTESDFIEVTVGPNQRPVIEPIERLEVNVGEEVSFVVSASDPDGDDVLFVAAELPAGSSFRAETGTFDWVADRGGFFTPHIEARDSFGAFDEVFVTVIVIDRSSENRAPVVEDIEDVLLETDDAPVELTLEVVAEDPDGDDLTYFWQLENRTFLGASASITTEFEYGEYVVECFVSDSEATSRISFEVEIRSTEIAPPVADAGFAQTVRMRAEDDALVALTLDGRASFDPLERGGLAYSWTQKAGPEVELFGATSGVPTFDQPIGEGVLRFELVVVVEADGSLVTSEPSEATVLLDPDSLNARPGAFIDGPGIAQPGDVVSYSGELSEDPDGDELEFLWSVERGAATVRGATGTVSEVEYGTPDDGEWDLVLTVFDGDIYSVPTSRAIRQTSSGNNDAPEARARLVGSPRVGSTIMLDASDSQDANDDDLTFAWTQTAGTTQQLTGTERPVADVELQGEPGDRVTFEVEVSDGELADSASVEVLLLAPLEAADVGSDVVDGSDAGVDVTDGSDFGGGDEEAGDGGGCSSSSSRSPAALWLVGLAIVAIRRRRRD
ncbi:MAG: MYXO-CTERM domain-containing protein [Bradymonadia bacterium]|jgi:MYXO-CTERM domain-containing protein